MLNLYNTNNTGTEIGLGRAIPIGIEGLQRRQGAHKGRPYNFRVWIFCFICVL